MHGMYMYKRGGKSIPRHRCHGAQAAGRRQCRATLASHSWYRWLTTSQLMTRIREKEHTEEPS